MMNTPRFPRACVLLITMIWTGAVWAQLSSEDITVLQKRAEEEHWTFTVGENGATQYPLSSLCGYVRGEGWPPQASKITLKPAKDLPERFDWRELGGCTTVKSQGFCGSCWAFATVAAIECAILIVDGLEVDLSEQWAVSCNQNGWDCGGGFECFHYFLPVDDPGVRVDPCGHSGAVLEADFPYAAMDLPCACPYPHPYTISSWAYVGSAYSIPPIADIKQAIMEYGPVTVGVYSTTTFHAYTGGIFGGAACETGYINHLVALVGWDDTLGAEGCWIMRNSWGPDWGSDGYMYIEYGCNRIGDGACFPVYNGEDPLHVVPRTAFESTGLAGGPFTPASQTQTLTNNSPDTAITWSAQTTAKSSWLELSSTGGVLDPGAQTTFDITIKETAANTLAPGVYSEAVTIRNEGNGWTCTIDITLTAGFQWFPFDTDPGWTAESGWAFGVPQGLGGEHGIRDPGTAYSGMNVYGYNLAGDYENGIDPPRYLTTTALDCTGQTDVALIFRRWLGVETNAYDHAAIEASNDGTTWEVVWSNTSEIKDDQWRRVAYDISEIADNQPTVFLRWAMGTTDDNWPYCGWNIDDVVLTSCVVAGEGEGEGEGEEEVAPQYPIDFCQALDDAVASLDTVMILLPPEYQAIINDLVCAVADINGGLDGETPLPNGMLDGAYELGIIAAVLNDAGFTRPNGLNHAAVAAAFENNFYLVADAILNSEYIDFIQALAPGIITPVATALAGYTTEGDEVTLGAIEAAIGLLEQIDVKPPNIEDFQGFPQYFGPESDADSDGYTNRQEYNAYQALGAKTYVTNALDSYIYPDGEGAEEGMIEGAEEGEGIVEEGQEEGPVEGLTEGMEEGGEEGENEGAEEGEGIVEEGEEEGVSSEGTEEGEGIEEGEGVEEGESEGVSEGAWEEGETEGQVEGTTEGASEGVAEGEGVEEGMTSEGSPEEGEAGNDIHNADQDGDGVINLSELLRVIQFYNSEGYHCDAAASEDGYAPGPGDQSCIPHASDYNPQDWRINLSELLRLIQFFNSGGYHPCIEGEDGYCPGPV
ncbi:MAG TPA: C1 family peptidase [Candidatus Hydrogenedentes bacterium]|nr:C1 family peptidase [Candidatus Hydrogenedentota bacterium]